MGDVLQIIGSEPSLLRERPLFATSDRLWPRAHIEVVKVPYNQRMQPTSQSVIKFACANLPPLCLAADSRR